MLACQVLQALPGVSYSVSRCILSCADPVQLVGSHLQHAHILSLCNEWKIALLPAVVSLLVLDLSSRTTVNPVTVWVGWSLETTFDLYLGELGSEAEVMRASEVLQALPGATGLGFSHTVICWNMQA